ncbi:MAG: AI-2E family transporter, partial [Dehalococcoidia bacterium]
GLAAVQVAGILFHPLLLVLAAVVIATAVSPLAARLERWVPRVAAVLLVYLAVFLVFTLIGWVVVPPLAEQAETLAVRAPELASGTQQWLEERGIAVDGEIQASIGSSLERVATSVLTLAPAIFAASLEIFLVLAMSVYLVIAAPAMLSFMLSLFPADQRDRVRDVLTEMARTTGGYVRGTVLDGLIVAVIAYIGLTIIGVDFPLVLALLAFLGELVPVVGPIVAAVPAVGIALTESVTQAAIVAVFYLVLQQFESYVLLPNIMRSQADIPPLLTLIALVAGAAIAGIVGAILAIPLLGGVYVFVIRVVAPGIRAWNGADATDRGL